MTLYAVESGTKWPPGVQPPEGLPTTPIRAVVDMTERTCVLDDCDGKVFAREWCRKHYARWQRHGDPLTTYSSRDLSIEERIDSRVDRDGPDGCWLWTGYLNKTGYGVFHTGEQSSRLVHRYMYERFVGPVPADLALDHLCHTRDESCSLDCACPHRRCVNPAHLEPVTHAENARRARTPANLAVRTNRCKRGHDLTVNGYVRKQGGRNCVACQRLRKRAAAAARRRSA